MKSRGLQDVGLKFLGKGSFVDLALPVGSTKFQGGRRTDGVGTKQVAWQPCPASFLVQAQSGVNQHVQPRPG